MYQEYKQSSSDLENNRFKQKPRLTKAEHEKQDRRIITTQADLTHSDAFNLLLFNFTFKNKTVLFRVVLLKIVVNVYNFSHLN